MATPSSTVPTTHRCVVQGEGGKAVVEEGRPVAPLEAGMVLVRTAWVALNPNDYKMADSFPSPGLAMGSDFAGSVVAVGAGVDRQHLRVGDRVCGGVHGSNPLRPLVGAFGEFVTAWADGVLKVPQDMFWEEAVAIGGAVPATLGLVMRETLQLPGDVEAPAITAFAVLVWGGSTASGTMAIQLLKLAGANVIATASPSNFELVRRYGADAVFDYASASCAADINTFAQNRLRYCLDVIGTAATMAKCYAALGRAGGRYTSLEKFDPQAAAELRRSVKADFALGLTMSGERIDLPDGYGSEARPDRRELARGWFASLQRLLDAYLLRAHPPRVHKGGLHAVPGGLEELRRGVSGVKLVYDLSG